MRTLMLIASIAMTGAGLFCVANGSVAFINIAFIIGLVFCLMGLVEIIIGFRADFDVIENASSITKDGIIMMIFGIVILSGQITDDSTAEMLFAMWLTIEGVLAFNHRRLNLTDISALDRTKLIVNLVMLFFGVYLFFNILLFNFPAALLIGSSLIILGIRRFIQSFEVEYTRPGFITGNEEKLQEALAEEKRALAKAKEGIREQKNAQRRIRKIREDIAAEQDVRSSAMLRRQERELERKGEE